MTKPWGELTFGPFAVGFRQALATDHSRHYGASAGAGTPRGFRPVLVATWYPAVPTPGGIPLTYGDYLTVVSEDTASAPFAARLSEYVWERTMKFGLATEPGEMDAMAHVVLAERKSLPQRAVRAAPPAEGRFPVVFYHPGNGSSYDDNSILCEYLASHGFLVVGSAFQQEDAVSLHVDWDLDRSFRDLGFLMNVLAADPRADVTRIGGVGHSYGGQALMAWSSEVNNPLRAVVSLDSGVEYRPSADPLSADLKKPLSRSENVTAAWLLVARKARQPDWQQWDYLTRTPRWFAETGYLEHWDFTSQGLIGTVRRKRDQAEAARMRQRYEAVCELTLRFLEAYLKEQQEAHAALIRQASEEIPADTDDVAAEPLLTLSHRPPEEAL